MGIIFMLLTLAAALLAAATPAAAQNACHSLELHPGQVCTLSIAGSSVTIDPSGLLAFPNAEPVRIPLPDGLFMESTKSYDLEGATLLVLEITDVESSSTLLTMLDHKTRKLRWTQELPAFNASPPLFSGNALYMGAIGTVAKVMLTDGKVQWQHRDLYEQDTQAFNAFQKPKLEGSVVVFPEHKSPTAKYSGLRQVRVEDKSGKLLSK